MPTATGEMSATEIAAQQSAASPSAVVTEEGDGNDPSKPSVQYDRMKVRWTKCRDVMLGTEAIRAGGTKYLHQYEGESAGAYNVRKVLAAFYNAYKRTVLASVGMLLEEEPKLDQPDELVALWENVDAAGTHGAVFTRRLATAGMVDAYAGILVEHSRPDDPGVDLGRASFDATIAVAEGRPLSSDDEKALGLRPYFLLFKADDVLRTIYSTVNGVRTLVLLVLRETVSERVGSFGIRSVEQYRVYQKNGAVVSYELWRKPESESDPRRVEGPRIITNQTQIPWAPFVAGEEVALGEWSPPLIDLADLNIQYHNSLTNHLSLQALAYVPTPVRIGAKPDANGDYPEITLGPRNTIEAPATEGVSTPIYWFSPPVDVLAAGAETLTATKADMGALGASFLAPETRAAETAEGKRIDSAAQRATLSTVSRALKDCLETAFGFMASYRRLKGGSVTLNDNFTGEEIDPQYLSVIVAAYQEGGITLEELRHVIQTGQLPEDFDSADVDLLMALAESRRVAKEEAAARIAGESQPKDVAA